MQTLLSKATTETSASDQLGIKIRCTKFSFQFFQSQCPLPHSMFQNLQDLLGCLNTAVFIQTVPSAYSVNLP